MSDSYTITLGRKCEQCRKMATLRKCTRQYLCKNCRQRPEYRLINQSEILRKTGFTSIVLESLGISVVTTASNPVNPRFPRMKMYWYHEVRDFLNKYDIPHLL